MGISIVTWLIERLRPTLRGGLFLLAAGLLASATACGPEPGDEPSAGADPVVAVMAAIKISNDDIECGPYVDGIADSGDSFLSGACAGDTCTDPCGCVCVLCMPDNGQLGVCYGVCSGIEGCDPLSVPPGSWRTIIEGQILVEAER